MTVWHTPPSRALSAFENIGMGDVAAELRAVRLLRRYGIEHMEHACNAHDKLVAALTALVENAHLGKDINVHWPDAESDPEGTPLWDFARAALTEAKEHDAA